MNLKEVFKCRCLLVFDERRRYRERLRRKVEAMRFTYEPPSVNHYTRIKADVLELIDGELK